MTLLAGRAGVIGCPVLHQTQRKRGRKQSEAEVRMGAELLDNCGILKKKCCVFYLNLTKTNKFFLKQMFLCR